MIKEAPQKNLKITITDKAKTPFTADIIQD